MKDFITHISAPNQQFKCYLNTDRTETITLTVNLTNELNPGATADDLSLLTKLIPLNNEEIVAFYKVYNGIKLYCHEDTAGLQFYPVDQLEDLHADWKQKFLDLGEEEVDEFQKKGFAFGEITHSSNYFILYDGKVYYDDHDGGDESPLAETFFDFLSKIVANPANFLYEMGCYTRYWDGKTDGQYIPKVHVSG